MRYTNAIVVFGALLFTLSACQPLPRVIPKPGIPSKPQPSEPNIPTILEPPAIQYPKGVERPRLSPYELRVISDKIYFNEASSKPEQLMHWANGENFASVGIGHFIWYPSNEPKRFDETFPSMIDYFIKHGIEIPGWLKLARHNGAPWPNKISFERARQDSQFQQLKLLLFNTKELQTQFFFDRIHESIPEIVKLIPAQDRQRVINNYNTLANTRGGWYPMIDYINFKGKGTKLSERYNHQGWGLLQALQEMKAVTPGQDALDEFSRATQAVLVRRVHNSPPANNEKRWLPGWIKRTNSYRQPII